MEVKNHATGLHLPLRNNGSSTYSGQQSPQALESVAHVQKYLSRQQLFGTAQSFRTKLPLSIHINIQHPFYLNLKAVS